ncbi:MAG: hypothetical protein ACOYJS_03620, partial [Acutalibacteraceae bacterium]
MLNYKRPAFWVITISIVAVFVLLLWFFANPLDNAMKHEPLEIQQSKSYVAGISAIVKNYDLSGEKPYIEVLWKNEDQFEHFFGKAINILYRNENGEYISCAKEDHSYELLSVYLTANETKTIKYDVSNFDLSNPGEYRMYLNSVKEPKIQID